MMRIWRGAVIMLFLLLMMASPFEVTSLRGDNYLLPLFSNRIENLYTDLELDGSHLSYEVFQKALSGLNHLTANGQVQNSGIITIADLSQPSVNKRLYVIDLKSRCLLFNTWVAHGKNTGALFAEKFSNKHESYQSSQGFYVTGATYEGKHGFSLQLHGMEPGVNDNALDRAIVIHGADYVSEEFIRQTGRLGRSYGCPAVSNDMAAPIISTIKDGTTFYVYHPSVEDQKKTN